MRVGSGGVMLPALLPRSRWPRRFSVLAGLFPGRIDLGIGRAAGTDPTTTFALQRDRRAGAPDDFPQQLAELLAYLRDEMPDDHPFRAPRGPAGAAGGARALAARLVAAERDLGGGAGPALRVRRLHQRPGRRPWRRTTAIASRRRPSTREPRVIVGVSAICADTDEEAERLASSVTMAMRLLRRGHLIPLPPVETAMAWIADEDARRRAQDDPGRPRRSARRMVVGSPATVRSGLEEVAAEYGAQELLVVTITYDHAARMRSYELISDAFALGRPAAVAGPAAA